MNAAPLVLVVDAVAQHLGRGGDLHDAERAARAAASVVHRARQVGVHVVHTHLQFCADGLDGGHYFRRNPELAAYAGRSVALAPELAPLPGELVVPRAYPSALFATSLVATVRGAEADTVLLVGSRTSESIRFSALDALQHGFVPVIVADGVTDVSQERHERALADLTGRYADVVPAQVAIDLLLPTPSA